MPPRIMTDGQVVFALLKRRITVTPLVDPKQIGTTIDLRLGTEFVVKRMDRLTSFDPVEWECPGFR